MFQDLTSLVVDLGTAHSRIGYGGDDAPKLMPHSCISSHSQTMEQEGNYSYLVGDKHLSTPLDQHEIHSIFNKKGLEGYQFDQPKLESFLQYNL